MMDSADDSRGKFARIELSANDLVRAAEAALDTRALAHEHTTRFARPDERRDVGLRINPESARVFFIYAQVLDPYGDLSPADFPEDGYCVGRMYFAVDPDEGIAVSFYDLPEETRTALYEKQDAANREGWRRLVM